jgi:hypothetical protein
VVIGAAVGLLVGAGATIGGGGKVAVAAEMVAVGKTAVAETAVVGGGAMGVGVASASLRQATISNIKVSNHNKLKRFFIDLSDLLPDD